MGMIPALYTHAGAALLAGALAFAGAWHAQACAIRSHTWGVFPVSQLNKPDALPPGF